MKDEISPLTPEQTWELGRIVGYQSAIREHNEKAPERELDQAMDRERLYARELTGHLALGAVFVLAYLSTFRWNRPFETTVLYYLAPTLLWRLATWLDLRLLTNRLIRRLP